MPITSSVLNNMCRYLSLGIFSPFIDLMLLCIFKMAFFGFLRCGEFTCRSFYDSSQILRMQDISIDPLCKYFVIHLKASKCDPFRKGVNLVIYENEVFHPVNTMLRYIQMRKQRGALPNSPLFVEGERNDYQLSRTTFISFLRQILGSLGYNDSEFCGHSFRIGAATSAAASGVADHIIQSLGRWSSDCYMRYIRIDSKSIQNAQSDMCFFN